MESTDNNQFNEMKRLAEQGDTEAQYNLGRIYNKGEGVTKNYKEAFKWYSLAANQGDASAQYSLGNMYLDGKGVIQDDKEAYKWFLLACVYGDSDVIEEATSARSEAEKYLSNATRSQAQNEAKAIQARIDNK